MTYCKRDIEAAIKKIHDACPNVVFEHMDYGSRLDGYKVDAQGFAFPETIRTVFQPARSEVGQPEIIADVDELIKFWST